jgi:hypothetical protein
MAKDTIAHIQCGTCDFPDAHLRQAKTGRLYVMCPECKSQSFSRSPAGDEKLKAKARAIKPANSEEGKPDGKHDTKPARNFWTDDVFGLGAK